MYNPFSLEGKTILITGASSGIGRATAIECSKLGANVIISGRNEERLAETRNSLICQSGQEHMSIIADLTDEIQTTKLVESIDSIDGVVNNAGVNRIKPIHFIKMEDLDYIFHSNTFSSVTLTKMLVKKKKIKNGGSIVFTSSVSAFYNAPGRALYASSKSALTSFMRSFAIELAEKNIRANAVHPGMIETNFIKENLSEEDLKKNISEYPLKRFGKPEEIAWAIIYLLSDASSWVTGTSMIVDGGFMIK